MLVSQIADVTFFLVCTIVFIAHQMRWWFNPFLPTVPTFAVRETDVSRHKWGTWGATLKPIRDDSALRALSSLRGWRGAPEVPPSCRETSVSRTANVGTVGKNWLNTMDSECMHYWRSMSITRTLLTWWYYSPNTAYKHQTIVVGIGIRAS